MNMGLPILIRQEQPGFLLLQSSFLFCAIDMTDESRLALIPPAQPRQLIVLSPSLPEGHENIVTSMHLWANADYAHTTNGGPRPDWTTATAGQALTDRTGVRPKPPESRQLSARSASSPGAGVQHRSKYIRKLFVNAYAEVLGQRSTSCLMPHTKLA